MGPVSCLLIPNDSLSFVLLIQVNYASFRPRSTFTVKFVNPQIYRFSLCRPFILRLIPFLFPHVLPLFHPAPRQSSGKEFKRTPAFPPIFAMKFTTLFSSLQGSSFVEWPLLAASVPCGVIALTFQGSPFYVFREHFVRNLVTLLRSPQLYST